MSTNQLSRERLIEAATSLIEQSGGDLGAITSRAIAKRAGMGAALINYHFGGKEALIEACVQRMIRKVIVAFDTGTDAPAGPRRLSEWAIRVFDFLFEHPAVARLSILGDMMAPQAEDNTALSARGFAAALTVVDKQLAFSLVAVMQSAFLRWKADPAFTGMDLGGREARHQYIAALVASLWRGYHAD